MTKFNSNAEAIATTSTDMKGKGQSTAKQYYFDDKFDELGSLKVKEACDQVAHNKDRRFTIVPRDESKYSTKTINDAIDKTIALAEYCKRLTQYQVFALRHEVSVNCHKGDIFEIDFGSNVEAEFSGRHYGVVLADSFKSNPTVLVCPLKTNHHGACPYSDVDVGVIPGLQTDRTTIAVVNQVRTISKMRLYAKNIINCDGEEQYLSLDQTKVDFLIKFYVSLLLGRSAFQLTRPW